MKKLLIILLPVSLVMVFALSLAAQQTTPNSASAPKIRSTAALFSKYKSPAYSITMFDAWVQNNLKHPKECDSLNKWGTVKAEFSVLVDGSVKCDIISATHPALGVEVARAAATSPAWTPATMWSDATQKFEPKESSFTRVFEFCYVTPEPRPMYAYHKPERWSAEETFTTYRGDSIQASFNREKSFSASVNAYKNWLALNTTYPQECADKGISGEVSIAFEIDKSGQPRSARIWSSPNPLLSSAAIKLINESPKWRPASVWNYQTERYDPMVSRFTAPIRFITSQDGVNANERFTPQTY